MRPVLGAMDLIMCWTQAKSPLLAGGIPAKLRPYGSLVQTSSPHFSSEKGGIGDDAVEGGEVVTRKESRITQSVPADNLEIRCSMQKKVHAGDGGRGQILLLAIELAPQRANISPGLLNVMDCLQKHPAGAASRVVDELALPRIKDVHH